MINRKQIKEKYEEVKKKISSFDTKKFSDSIQKVFELDPHDPSRRSTIKKIALWAWGIVAGVSAYQLLHEDEEEQKGLRKMCTLKDLEGDAWDKQRDYEEKYYAPNESHNNKKMNRKMEQQKVMKWFRNMMSMTCMYNGMEKSHLQMIIELAKDYEVPVEIVFLALAESGRKWQAQSWVKAAWYWQFMPATFRDVWWKPWEMSDPVRSTQCAMILYKDNLKHTESYLKQKFWLKYCERSDYHDNLHKYNLAHHNCWWWMLKRWINKSWWDFDEHFEAIKQYPAKLWHWRENGLYVPRILWIKNALNQLTKDGKFDDLKILQEIDSILDDNEKTLSTGDKAYEKYENSAQGMDIVKQEKILNDIIDNYKLDLDEKTINQEYYDSAIEFINKKIQQLNDAQNEKIDDNPEDIWYVKLNKSQDQRYQIYLYTIKKSATKDILFDKFKHEENSAADISKFIITDINGNEYEDRKFKKWEKLFIRYKIYNTFERIKKWVYKVTIKKSATPSLLKDKFLQEYPYTKNIKVCNEKWIEYTKRTFFASWDVVYIKIN